MRLMYLEIENFRGIRHAKLEFPKDSRIVCIIGSGDSCKSTILKAIEWSLFPSWNLVVTDNDFYNGKTEFPITITASVSELPTTLLKEDKFGLYLRDLDSVMQDAENDEPTDTGTIVLTIRLTVDSALEPKWEVITKRTAPKGISNKDRKLMALGVVGIEPERDFQWGRGSALHKRIDSRDTLHNAYTEAMRNAVINTTLDTLDEAITELKDIGKQYGVDFSGELHNQLLMQNSSFSTTAGLFDENVPFSQRGLGSKRLLSIGMNVSAYEEGTLVLVDEIETGLEPYRILRLVNVFRDVFSQKGQMIMTTHSISAVCECTLDELVICRNIEGTVVFRHLNKIADLKDDIQGMIRSEPGAFLSKRVIVCEGKTEVGLLRAYDRFILSKSYGSLAHFGTSIALGGGGDKFFKLAKFLKSCDFDVCILMDSDLVSEELEKQDAVAAGIPVFSWYEGNAIEEQIFSDSPLSVAQELIDYAVTEKSFDHVKSKLDAQFVGIEKPFEIREQTIYLSERISTEQLRAIGTIAKNKKSEWFKRIDRGEHIGGIIFSQYGNFSEQSEFRRTLDALQEWVIGNDKSGD